MSRVAFPLVLQSPTSGSALVGAKATITKHVVGASLGSGAEAEIFLTETESSKVAGNVITTDNTGRWTQGEGASPAYAQYWIPEGTYDVLISGTGLTSVYITRELVSGSGAAAGMRIVGHGSNTAALSGELVEATGAITVTSPTAEAGAIFGVLANNHAVTVKPATGKIYGDFIEAASEIKLVGYQHVILQSDGTNWFIVAGEPKREQKYVTKIFTKAEAEAGVEPSATRMAFVILAPTSESEIFVGGELITLNSGKIPWPLLVPPGQKWKTTHETVANILLL